MESSVKLYSLSLKQNKAMLWALLFVVGNIALPQLCHLIPQGGFIFLPIYFFTLIGAYKYGWQVGLFVAFVSPLVNHLLFGMPATAALPVLFIKSGLLALCAAFVANRFHKVTLPLLILVVAAYQLIGSVAEWIITGNLGAALQDVRLGMPGLALQIVGGFLVLRYLLKK